MESYKMTYNEVVDYCSELADKLIAINPCLIVGVARGGLVPAVHLSHLLKLPMECLLWQTRDGGTKEDNEVISAAIGAGGAVVFVDDINDSGQTFTEIRDHYGTGYFVCLLEKKQSKFRCNYAGDITDTERWIDFPWEYVKDE